MEDIKTMCPSCGADMNDGEEVCLSCGFAFATVLKCPFKDEDNKCTNTGHLCNVHGLGYEACESLREPNN